MTDRLPDRPIIVTAKLDETSQFYFDDLREKYFPAQINYLKAHLTLFHKLPGSEVELIKKTAESFGQEFPQTAAAETPYSIGNGVAIRINSTGLVRMHRELSVTWSNWLTPQDRQSFRPHVTVQNKVSADAAKSLLASLSSKFTPFTFKITGIELWHYAGGPWEPVV